MRNVLVVIVGIAIMIWPTSEVGSDSSRHPTAEGASIQCKDSERIREAESLLDKAPLRAIEILKGVSDCDDKFALLYRAEHQIAQMAPEGFYYEGEVNPCGWYAGDPNDCEEYIIENPDHFYPAEEGRFPVRANDYWLTKIRNRRHEAIGEFELVGIQKHDPLPLKDQIRTQPDRFLWVDREVGPQQVLDLYREWTKKWQNHRHISIVPNRIWEIEVFELLRLLPDTYWKVRVKIKPIESLRKKLPKRVGWGPPETWDWGPNPFVVALQQANASSVIRGDFNKDGKDDIVIAGGYEIGGNFVAFYTKDKEKWTLVHVLSSSPRSGPAAIAYVAPSKLGFMVIYSDVRGHCDDEETWVYIVRWDTVKKQFIWPEDLAAIRRTTDCGE